MDAPHCYTRTVQDPASACDLAARRGGAAAIGNKDAVECRCLADASNNNCNARAGHHRDIVPIYNMQKIE